MRSSSLDLTISDHSATLPTESATRTATPKATLVSPKTTVDASTQWSPGKEDQSIEEVVGGNVLIENKSINGDEVEHTESKESELRRVENMRHKDSDVVTDAKSLADASTDHQKKAATESSFPEEDLDLKRQSRGTVQVEEMKFPPCPQSFYVSLENEDSTDMTMVSGKRNPFGESSAKAIVQHPLPQELHERQFSNDDDINFTRSMPEFLNDPVLCPSPSADQSDKKIGCPSDASTTPATKTTAATVTKGCPPEFDKIKQLIEAKRKARERKDQRSKAVSYFYDINHSDAGGIEVVGKNILNNFDGNFNSDCLAADLSPDNGFNSTALNLFESSRVAVSRTRAMGSNHSAASSESGSSSCSSYYTDCKETASQESPSVVASLTTSRVMLPDILENAASLSEESKIIVVKDFLFSDKHLPQTMATLSEESDDKEACEENGKTNSGVGKEEVSQRTDNCAEPTLNGSRFETNVEKCVDEISTSRGGSNYSHSSHPCLSTPNLEKEEDSDEIQSTHPELQSNDLTTVRKILFGRMNSDIFQSTASPLEDKQNLSRSLSDCPSAEQNSRSARYRVETRLPHLHNYSHNLAQLSSVVRYRYKPLLSKTDSHSSRDSYEDSLFQSSMTGSLDRLASVKELGIARRRNYVGQRLLTYVNVHQSHRHSEIPNSDSPTCEAYFSKPAPRPIPKVALAKLNEDGTPKSILKKKARFVQDLSADECPAECSPALGR